MLQKNTKKVKLVFLSTLPFVQYFFVFNCLLLFGRQFVELFSFGDFEGQNTNN